MSHCPGLEKLWITSICPLGQRGGLSVVWVEGALGRGSIDRFSQASTGNRVLSDAKSLKFWKRERLGEGKSGKSEWEHRSGCMITLQGRRAQS